MASLVNTVTFQGIHALTIEVQAQIAAGMPAFTIVGLPDKAVTEARERVRSALHGMGLSIPPKRITINLAPADVQKSVVTLICRLRLLYWLRWTLFHRTPWLVMPPWVSYHLMAVSVKLPVSYPPLCTPMIMD